MNIEFRPWYIAVIAVITILISLPDLYIVVKTIARIDQNALQHPLFYLKIFKSVLLFVIGFALLYRMSWCRFGYLLTSILVTFSFVIILPGVNLFYESDTDQVVLIAKSISISFVISWSSTVVIFMFFKKINNNNITDSPI